VQRADIGFDHSRLLSMRVVLAGDEYDSVQARNLFYSEAVGRIAALPGVAGATVTSAIPADDGGWHLRILTSADRDERDAMVVSVTAAGAGFFGAVGAPLHAGREFTAAEALDTAASVAIVGRALADRLWPGESPVGRSFRLVEHARSYTVIGVAPDLMYEEFGEETPQSRMQLHLPFSRFGWRTAALLVRAVDQPAALAQPVRAVLRTMDAGLAPYEVMTMRDRRALTSWNYRLFGELFAIFGLMALILALSGVYGVMAYAVARRRREIGVRVALGAAPGKVGGMIVKDAAVITSLGVGLGLAGALAISRLAESALYGVSASDPLTFIAVTMLFFVVALAASVIPARRAAHVDPMVVLRSD
jgi:predicted permease